MRLRSALHTLRNPKGATAVEYIIGIVLVACVLIGAFQLFGGAIGSQFGDSSDSIGGIGEEKEVDADTVASIDSSVGSAKNQRADLDTQVDGTVRNGAKGRRSANKKPTFEDRTQHPQMRPGISETEPTAGLNPLIILIFVVLGAVLCFVIFKGNKGE